MSLEVAIQQNTEAIRALLAEMVTQRKAIAAPTETLGLAVPAPVKPAAAPKAKPAAEPEPAAKPEPAAAEASKPETAPGDDPVAVPYETVRQATIDLVRAKGRSEAEALLKSFGASNAKELDVSAYAGYVAQARAAMGREHAA